MFRRRSPDASNLRHRTRARHWIKKRHGALADMFKPYAALVMLVLVCGEAHARPLPSLVPSGWSLEARDKEARTRRFVSPDGRASFTTRQTGAHPGGLGGDIDRMAAQDGEQVTYLRRGSSWIAVSGYRNGAIFYRKSNLACGGSRWNQA